MIRQSNELNTGWGKLPCLHRVNYFGELTNKTEKYSGGEHTIHNVLGCGLLEHAYEEHYATSWHNEEFLALQKTPRKFIVFKRSGIPFERQKVYALHYKGELIGGYIADLVVDNAVILELKSVTSLNQVMEAQLINYLKLSKVPVGYLIDFNGTRVEWRRFVCRRE